MGGSNSDASDGTVTGADIIVSGCDYTAINGTYKLVDSSKTGKERQWRKDTNPAKPAFIYWEDDRWYINDDELHVTYSYDDVDDPVRAIKWENPDGFWTVPPTLSYVGSSSEGGGSLATGTNIIVAGAGSTSVNGTYTLTNIVIDKDYLSDGQKKVYSYYSVSTQQNIYIYYDWNSESWWISYDYNNHDIPMYGSTIASSDNPWDGGTWVTGDASDPSPTVTKI